MVAQTFAGARYRTKTGSRSAGADSSPLGKRPQRRRFPTAVGGAAAAEPTGSGDGHPSSRQWFWPLSKASTRSPSGTALPRASLRRNRLPDRVRRPLSQQSYNALVTLPDDMARPLPMCDSARKQATGMGVWGCRRWASCSTARATRWPSTRAHRAQGARHQVRKLARGTDPE